MTSNAPPKALLLDVVTAPLHDDPVKTATLEELQKDGALLKEVGPILVTKEGHPIGFFRPLPLPDETIPIEQRRELFREASEKVRRQLESKGISEEQVDRDIAAIFEDDRR